MANLLMLSRRRGSDASTLFFDDFSSGDFSKSNANFSWGGRTNVAVISGFSRAGNTGQCVRFNFGNTANQLSELRFCFGPTNDTTGATALHHPEVWLRYYIYFPTGNESPFVGPKAVNANASNNKFFRCFALPESDYPRYGASFYRGAGYGLGSVAVGDAEVGPQAGQYPGTGTVSQVGTSYSSGLLNDSTEGSGGRWSGTASVALLEMSASTTGMVSSPCGSITCCSSR